MTRSSAFAPLALAALAVLGSLSPASGGAFRMVFRAEGRAETVETVERDGVTYFSVADLARASGAVRHWNPQNGKLTLSVNGRRISASADNRFVRCDDSVRNLRLPLLRGRGDLWAPPAYLTDALAWALDSDVTWDAEAALVSVMTRRVVVTSAAIEESGDGATLAIGLSGQAEFSTDLSEGVLEVLIRAAGVSDSLALPHGSGLVRGVAVQRLRAGVLVTAALSGDAGVHSTVLRADPTRLEVSVARGARGAAESPAREPRAATDVRRHGLDEVIDTVIIDPGHGGSDLGAWITAGYFEKDLSLAFARQLRPALEREGFHVLMTRDQDDTVPLKQRAETANLAEADILLSVHCGASFSTGAAGPLISSCGRARRATTLAHWSTTGRSGRGGAARWDRVQDRYAAASGDLVAAIRRRVALRAARPATQTGDFATLSGCSMPAVMVEIGFVTNAADARLLADVSWREGLASAVAAGVSDFRADVTREGL